MVRVTGPFLSLKHKGSLADTLTGPFWRGVGHIKISKKKIMKKKVDKKNWVEKSKVAQSLINFSPFMRPKFAIEITINGSGVCKWYENYDQLKKDLFNKNKMMEQCHSAFTLKKRAQKIWNKIQKNKKGGERK